MKEFKFTAEDFSWLPGSRADEPIPLSKLAQLGCAHIANARVAPLLARNSELEAHLSDCSGLTCGEAGDLNHAAEFAVSGVNALEAEVTRLRSALQFYADNGDAMAAGECIADGGDKAKEALTDPKS